jgi:RNA methyltransferase, TrmH family
MELITSRSNPKIKQIRALRQHKGRTEGGLLLVEGIRPVGEAVEAGAELDAIVYAPDQLRSAFAQQLVERLAQAGVACLAVSTDVLESLAEKENPQGLLAVVRRPSHSLEQLTAENFPWGVALVAPQDPGNLGAILRTIDAAGASGLLLLDSALEPYQAAVARASMGTMFWYPIVEASFEQFLAWARSQRYTLYGTSAHAPVDYRQAAYASPRILLLGSEQKGLSAEQMAACDVSVSLPMHGKATSLNLAVAAGILLYQMLDTPA